MGLNENNPGQSDRVVIDEDAEKMFRNRHYYQDYYGQPNPPSAWELERRVALLEQTTDTLGKELKQISQNMSRLVWIVVGAVILAGINVIISDKIGTL